MEIGREVAISYTISKDVAEARADPERLQSLSKPPALLVSGCRHSASVGP